MGGTGNIVNAFEKLMNEVGVKIIKGQEIIKINHENRKVKNIVLKNSDILEIDSVICNADPPKVYDELIYPKPNNQSKINWEQEGKTFKDKVIRKLEQTCMPELSKHVEAEIFVTPNYFEKELNTKYGSGFSIEPVFTQSAYFRFHNKSEILDNLYFVGAGAHPGAGIPGVLSSAKVLDHLDI